MAVAGPERPPKDQLTNVFLAIKPGREEAARVYHSTAPLCSCTRLSRRPPEILHVTLLSLGGWWGGIPASSLDRVIWALEAVRFPKVDLAFDRAISFGSRKATAPFVLIGEDVVGAMALHLAVRDALRVKGLDVGRRSGFTPHMTLAYGEERLPAISVAPIGWRAVGFQLVESWVEKTRHVTLKSWPLL